jgi:3-hydroxyisobutyrate dehydrogenase
MTTISFIGLGAMGSGMAASLACAGHDVAAFDLNPAAVETAVKNGCRRSDTLKSALEGADFVVSMLPTGRHVLSVYEEIRALAPSGAMFIDCSTIAVEDARTAIAQAEAAGFLMCDAPVSGGVAAAAAGTLTFMVGGGEDAFAKAQPILSAMGKAVIHAGQAGAGQAAKICNNMLLAVSMIGTCEAFVLAESLGLDARRFFEIASQSSGQCWSLTSYAPVPELVPNAPSNRDFANGFAGALMLKDLRLALEAAANGQAQTPMALKAEDIYSKYVSNYNPDRDFSGVIAMLRNK